MAGSDHAAIAVERERFLSLGGISRSEAVSADVLRSWRRSLLAGVDPSASEPRFEPDVDPEAKLIRAAAPVLDEISEHLADLSVSFVLTDPAARIVDRRVCDPAMRNRLDRANATFGFVFAEDQMGTNALGTAIESRRSSLVAGHEHYAESLRSFVCVGVPIFSAFTHRIEGVLGVGCPRESKHELIGLLAEQVAARISQRVVEQHSLPERHLLQSFQAANRGTRGGVLAVNQRTVIANAKAARLMEGVDSGAIWEHASRAVARGDVGAIELPAPAGVEATVVPITNGPEIIGALVKFAEPKRRAGSRPPSRQAAVRPGALVGTSREWLNTWSRASRAVEAPGGVILVLSGEPGVGKVSLARTLIEDRILDGAFVDWNAARNKLTTLERRMRNEPAAILVRHVEKLSPADAQVLGELLEGPAQHGTLCIATAAGGNGEMPLAVARAVEVGIPPLRDRIEDIALLVAAFAAPRRVTPEVVQLLTRHQWIGNVRELRGAVERMLDDACHGRALSVADMPAEFLRSTPRRDLSRFERDQVNAIVRAIAEAGGNRKLAAEILGISRSTLYRKMQAAGIDLDNTIF